MQVVERRSLVSLLNMDFWNLVGVLGTYTSNRGSRGIGSPIKQDSSLMCGNLQLD